MRFNILFTASDRGFEPELTTEDIQNVFDSVMRSIENGINEGRINDLKGTHIGDWIWEKE